MSRTKQEDADRVAGHLQLPALSPVRDVWMGLGECVGVHAGKLGAACQAGVQSPEGRCGRWIGVCTHTCRAGMGYVALLHGSQMCVPVGAAGDVYGRQNEAHGASG